MNFIVTLLFANCLFFGCTTEIDPQASTLAGGPRPPAISVIQFFKTAREIQDSSIEVFTLNQDEQLSIQFKLDEPLIASLRKLAPKLSDQELIQRGNFQFTFSVNEQPIYTQHLQTGAGTLSTKTELLNYQIPLIAPQPVDHWGWFMWLRFMKMAGGRDALVTGKHRLQLEVRPYLQGDEFLTGNVLARGQLTVKVPEISVDQDLIAIQPIRANSSWEISSDQLDTTRIEALNRKIAEKRFEQIKGIVIAKDGKLLLEEYFNGSSRDSLHDVRSVGKSFASTMMGIAIGDGHIANENLTLGDFYDLKKYANYSPAKGEVTLKSLLTMSSGFLGDDNDYNSPGNENNMYPTDDWVKFGLNLPMDESKEMGKDYAYFTAGVVVLGDVLHRSIPGGLVDYADKQLFAPLGITDYRWQYTPQNVGNTAGSIQLRAIDFAKYGQLYKDRGQWKGKAILSPEWVDKSFDNHVTQPEKNSFYGYLFWNKTYHLNGQDHAVSFCTGNGGNKIFIFKDLPYVVVITASAYGLPYAHQDVDKMMVEYILPALLQ